MNRACALVLALVLAGSLVEPALAVTLTVAHSPQTLSAYPSAFGPIDPIAIGDCLEGLVTEDVNGAVIAGQAESWTVSPDGMTYTFHLRPDARWSNGAPVVAEDFRAAFRWLFDPANASDFAFLQFSIRNGEAVAFGLRPLDDLGVRAIDARTLEISLERPTPYFLQTLLHSSAYPVPSREIEAHGADWLVPENVLCNGPFQITGQKGEETTARLSQSYYARDGISVDTVTYRTVSELADGLDAYGRGEIDLFYDLPGAADPWIAANADDDRVVTPFLGIYFAVFNLDRPPLDDPRLRKALAMAVERSVLAPQGFTAPRSVAYGLVPPSVPNFPSARYRPEWAGWSLKERRDAARTMLEEMGFSRTAPLKLQLRYSTGRGDQAQNVARAIAGMWQDLPVEIALYGANYTDHYNALRAGDFDIAQGGWLYDYPDAANGLALLASGSGFNFGRYANTAYDALLDRAAVEPDLARRADLLQAAEAMAMDDNALIAENWTIVQNLIRPGLTGIAPNVGNVHRARWIGKLPIKANPTPDAPRQELDE